jgi:hypothetical protein
LRPLPEKKPESFRTRVENAAPEAGGAVQDLVGPAEAGLTGDDVDHAAEGVGAVRHRRRPPHDLDALHLRGIEERGVRAVAAHAVHRAAVHQHEHALAGEPANRRALLPGAVLVAVHARERLQHVSEH